MDVGSYYRRALWLPIGLPLAAPFVLAPAALLGGRVAEMAGSAVMLLAGALVVSVIPYLAFFQVFAWWADGAPERRLRRAVLLAPPRFTSAMCGMAGVVMLPMDVPGGAWRMLGFVAVRALGVGYFYVALIELGRMALCREGGRPIPVGTSPRREVA